MLVGERLEGVLVAHGEHELLAGGAELAGRGVERREDDLLEDLGKAVRISQISLRARIGDRCRLVGRAAEREIRHEHGRDGAERDEQRKRPSHSGFPLPTATGTSAASARAAARRNGPENASVTARSS